MGFCSLQHFPESKVHLTRALLARYVPPSGFGYPRDGFLPFDPWPVLFHTGSAPGIHPSKPDSKQVSRCFHLEGPTYRFTCRCFQRRSTGPAQQASVPGLCPCREFRSTHSGFNTAAVGGSPGFRPSRVSHESLDQDSARPPLTRFFRPNPEGLDQPAPQSIDRLSLSYIRTPRFPEEKRTSNPIRVPAPARS
jgi:hypothetical protein